MNANSIKLKMKLDDPVYLDENTVKVGYSLSGSGINLSNNLIIKNNGQGWSVER